jgi:hypothetical protein
MLIRKITNEPAIANEDTSTPNTPSKGLPMNRNAMKIINETNETFPESISPVLALMSRITGMGPGMSIMAKSTINEAKISIRLRCISDKFQAKVVRKNECTSGCL